MNSADASLPRTRRLARVWDVVLFVMAIFWTAVAIVNVPGVRGVDGVTDLGAGLWLLAMAAWVTIFFRRQLPVLPLGAGLVLALIGTGYLLFLIGAYHAALSWRARERTWLYWGVPATVLLFWLRETLTPWGDELVFTANSGPTTTIILSTVLAVISLGAASGLLLLTQTKRQAVGERVRADVEQSHAARLGEELSRQSERTEIAREIHDGLTNRLALVSMMSGNLEKAVRAGDPDAASLAQDIQTQARDALADLRGLIGDLRTAPKMPAAQQASMSSLGDLITATRAAGTKLDAVVLVNGPYNVHPELDSVVFRLVQEALTNAVKHAPGHTVSLYLDAGPSTGVRLRVANAADHAAGVSLAGTKSGAGLTGMHERVSAFQGTTWTGEHDGEFIVDITLPWITADATLPGPANAAAPAGDWSL